MLIFARFGNSNMESASGRNLSCWIRAVSVDSTLAV